MTEFLEASPLFQNDMFFKMYAVLIVFFIGIAVINYRQACSKNDPAE